MMGKAQIEHKHARKENAFCEYEKVCDILQLIN